MPPRRKQQKQPINVLETLQDTIAQIFSQVSQSKASWTKNTVALYKLHMEASEQTEESTSAPGKIRIVGERAFETVFVDMLNRIVSARKGPGQAEKTVLFIGLYTEHLMMKDAETRETNETDDDDEDGTTASRFINRIIRHLTKGFGAKDKNVRYRCLQLIATMISHLTSLEPELYDELREGLLERINDKEASVRAQAATILAKLCGAEDLDDLDPDDRPANEILLDMLAHDASGEVRRAILVNIRLDGDSLSAILQRMRDVEPATRKLVFTNILLPNIWVKAAPDTPQSERVMGLTHPRALTIQQREDIVSVGLGDREDAVRAAAGGLVSEWMQALGSGKTTEESVGEDMLALLSTFDLVSGEKNEVALEALKSVFVTKASLFATLQFPEEYWRANALTPEKIFLARVHDDKLDAVLPVVTACAFSIQEAYNILLAAIQTQAEIEESEDLDEERQFEMDEARMNRIFVVQEMLKIALVLDYADEIGRRKMFQLVRDMISQESLPDQLVTPCMDVVRILANDERDFIRLVVQIVHELRDADDESASLRPEDSMASIAPSAAAPRQKPREEMTPRELKRRDDLDLRCLDLCISMLERVHSTFEDHSTLDGVLKELMVPSVMRKEMIFRERGLTCLGLCSLIAPRMATGAFQLFTSQIKTANVPEQLKIKVLQIVFDVILVHEREFLGDPNNREYIETLLTQQLGDESPKVQAEVCKGLAKLMLAGMTTNDDMLRALVMEYVSPDTVDNPQLRQCLTYFFPIYCYSSSVNQRRVMENFLPIFKTFLHIHSTLDEGEEMVTPAQFTAMFLEWTDPQHAMRVPNRTVDESIHVDFAVAIMKEILKPEAFSINEVDIELQKEDKKILCQMLPKLFLPLEADDLHVRVLHLLAHKLSAARPVRDAGAFSSVKKFDDALSKHYNDQLDSFDVTEYRKLEELTDLFEFLDDIFDSDGDDELVEPPARRGPKRRRKTEEDGDDDSDSDHAAMRRSPPTSSAPTRSMPRRAATRKVDMAPLTIDEDDEEDDEGGDDVEATPVPTRGRRAQYALSTLLPMQIP
ncbi:nuclear condensing complex subunits [Vararia minispora EC-137]|uniref:Nuclear condensing complex subunits n=1 Tax=Vararia minispora EC-137 TaxID=1314806 RepID=A0ACB8QFV4_9AGAM|nr:nuclear condensing complex subunits [Vararia minispora EC-137]